MKKFWFTLIIGILSIGLLVGAYYTYSIYSFVNNIYETSSSSKPSMLFSSSTVAADEPSNHEVNNGSDEPTEPITLNRDHDERVNILLIGVDEKATKKAPLTDTLVVASISPADAEVTFFSVLRDTYVEIKEGIWNRINAANPIGGIDLTMKAVSDLTGMTISRYLYTDFDGFIHLVDALGGVELHVERDMYRYDPIVNPQYNIDIKKGLQTLDGNETLQYLRFRDDERSDYGRTERQREFLTILAKELTSTVSIFKLPDLLKRLAPYLMTNLSPSEQWQLARFALQTDLQHINSVQIPPPGLFEPRRIDNMEVLTVDKQRIRDFVSEQLEKANH